MATTQRKRASRAKADANTAAKAPEPSPATSEESTAATESAAANRQLMTPDAGEHTAEGAMNDPPLEEIPALFIRTRKAVPRRRRAGFVFTPEGHGIALAALSADQIAAFESDPTLIVEECTFPADAEDAQ
ncbi:hypothetical protein [Modicisalibacter sp. MOD 31.J]|uniref:hypothetical protein n=1 Tax=Modicisalibacter sp. MOD 31.J TaxID=2831897 RepID=UPI001CCD6209|nr:hypothetical protein [Modicisalibacter sp. MOD 31.J]MBZ9574414.1 hypothetical protein [Modicisalibacter sp. MOD 31.J]